jgi:SpoVK/Ycf46/Vps4 family AAA+-type ATPase
MASTLGNEAGLPLLRFDMTKVYNQYVGQSESNMHEALKVIEQSSPLILWIEELGRLTVGKDSDADSGTTSRLLAIFLTWLQEHNKDVFVVATVNDIKNIPKEMIRKGRFSSVYTVEPPDEKEREEIWRIHLKRNGLPTDKASIFSKCVDVCTGAKIESVVVDALIETFTLKLHRDYAVEIIEKMTKKEK